jgi:hypothetical protein
MKKFIVNPKYANRAYKEDRFKESMLSDAVQDERIEDIYRLLIEGVNPNALLWKVSTDGIVYFEYPIGCPLDVATSPSVKRLLRYFGANKKMYKKHYDDSPNLPDYAKVWARAAERRRRNWLKEHIPELYST